MSTFSESSVSVSPLPAWQPVWCSLVGRTAATISFAVPEDQRASAVGMALTGERATATPNQTTHTLMRIEDASHRRFPRPISNHIPWGRST